MDQSVVLLIGMAGLAVLALTALALYGRQQKRIRMVKRWVRDYLVRGDSKRPDNLPISCSEDRRRPVLALSTNRQDGTRRRLHFACAGPTSSVLLLSKTEKRQEARAGADDRP